MSPLGTWDHPAVIWGTRSLLTQRKNTPYWELLSCFPLWWQKSTVQILCSLEKWRSRAFCKNVHFLQKGKAFVPKFFVQYLYPSLPSLLPPLPRGSARWVLLGWHKRFALRCLMFSFCFSQNKEDNVTTTPALGWGRISAQRRDEGIAPPGPPGPRPHRTPSPGAGPTVTARPGSRREMHRHLWRSQGGGQRHRAARASRVRQSEADHLNSPWLLLGGRENPCKASGRSE